MSLVVVAGGDGDLGSKVCEIFRKGGWVVSIHKKGYPVTGYKDVKCVVNCAGYYEKTDEEVYNKEIYENNFKIAESLLRYFTVLLYSTEGARIITISSIDGRFPNTNSFAYSISKCSINTLVRLYRKKYISRKVNFDLILPGAMDTRMRKDKKEDKAMLLQTEDIAKLCLYIAGCPSSMCFDDITVYPKSFTYAAC